MNRLLKWPLLCSLLVTFLSCSDDKNKDPQPEENNGNLVSATSVGTWKVENLRLIAQLSGQEIDLNLIAYDVEVFRIIYNTTYKDADITASGLVIVPKTNSDVSMVCLHLGTIVQQARAPSVQALQSEQVLSYSALASMGFITVVPDLIGFGESKDQFHPYYVEEPTVSAVVDMLTAANQHAAASDLSFNKRLFLAGYSQGGYVALATHKELESNPQDNFELIASFPGAGGYDLNAMLDYFIQTETYPTPHYLAYVGMSYQSFYNEPTLLDNFFSEPYASRIPSLFDGVNSGAEIDNELTEDIPVLLKAEVLSQSDSYPLNEFLQEKFAENSLVDWTPTAPVFMYHGTEDSTVPFQNSQLTYEQLLDNGADPDKLKLITLTGHDHESGVAPYVEDVVRKLSEMK